MTDLSSKIKVISFDADDTLWDNEIFFREAEERFTALFEDYLSYHDVMKELLKVEIKNIPMYGYGIKAFVLSMIETALTITDNKVNPVLIGRIMQLGKDMMEKPVTLLDGVEEVLKSLQGKYRLVVATKGDLMDQERKLRKSGLEKYFHHIEIMSEKAQPDYVKLIKHLDIDANQFMMVGNSLKSDILPVINLGGYGVHIPYHTTWSLEQIDHTIESDHFYNFEHASGILTLI
jgi:putative hydrolase of the HAD superfamily